MSLLKAESPLWLQGRKKPTGLDPDGFYTRGHVVGVDGTIRYIGPGPGIANLQQTGYRVEIPLRFERGGDPRRDSWGVGASLPTGDLE